MRATILCLFFFNDTATTEIYTLSLHDALPIFVDVHRVLEQHAELEQRRAVVVEAVEIREVALDLGSQALLPPRHEVARVRSEEHTSELQSRQYLVCRLLLEKKKTNAQSSIQYS